MIKHSQLLFKFNLCRREERGERREERGERREERGERREERGERREERGGHACGPTGRQTDKC